MRVSEILRRAAAKVRQGWTRGSLKDPLGHVCLVGAIDEVVQEVQGRLTGGYDYDTYAPIIHAAFRALPLRPAYRPMYSYEQLNFERNNLMAWNDSHERRPNEVEHLLLMAARLAEGFREEQPSDLRLHLDQPAGSRVHVLVPKPAAAPRVVEPEPERELVPA